MLWKTHISQYVPISFFLEISSNDIGFNESRRINS